MARLKSLLLVLFILSSLASCGTGSSDGDQSARGIDVPAVGAEEPESPGQEALPLEPGEEGEAGEEGELGGGSGSGGEPGGGSGTTGQCTRCARRARLEFDPSQGETGWEDWLRCMAENMPYETFDPQDPALEGALDACEQYEPEGGGEEVMVPSSVLNYLAATATTSCFHMTTGLAEYEFRYSWETGLEGDLLPNGKPVVSEFGLELEFRGDPQEIIQSWFTQSSVDTVTSHYSRMFENPDAELRRDLPLEEMLWEFEKTPESCEIEPDKDEVEPEEKIEVRLTDCVNSEGEESREFNRIIVEADEGTIHGGTPHEVNPYLHVFELGDGEVTFTYEAPDSTEHEDDTIRAYYSCEILTPKEQPLEKTWPRDQISLKTIRIKRPTGWTGTFTVNEQDSESYTDFNGQHSYSGRYVATASFMFVQDGSSTRYLALGVPGGSYSSSASREQISDWGRETATCSCAGGFLVDDEYSQSDLYIRGNEYDFSFILIGDAETDCEGERVTVDGLGNVDRHAWTGICLPSFVDCCGGRGYRGTFSGNTISGECTTEWEGGSRTCTWDFHRQ